MKKICILKSVLIGTLVVVFLCGCKKETADYMIAETESIQETESDSEKIEETLEIADEEVSLIYVYVCGEITNPGVYTLPEGSRVCDAFSLAGGFTPNAATDYWNQASVLKDGEMIYVPTIEQAKEREWTDMESGAKEENTSGKININTASKDVLMTIPGIGEAKANAIISYREANGVFSSIDEVKNVEGIKDGVFTKMKEYIVID